MSRWLSKILALPVALSVNSAIAAALSANNSATPVALGANNSAMAIGVARLPKGFVYLGELAPKIQQEMRYTGSDNFIGRPVAGYQKAHCILSLVAAEKLAVIQQQLSGQGLALKVFDCYRPQQAVDDFVRWSLDPDDQVNRAQYYPDVAKEQLFAKGYIAKKSSHSRGSAVDLTVIVTSPSIAAKTIPGKVKKNGELEMGTPFDWFGAESHTDNPLISADVYANRQWLKGLMEKYGFRNLPEEWWHFTLADEPFPDTYFDFPVR